MVTGAGSGLGAAYAEAAAALGAAVVVNDIDPALAADTAARITHAGGSAAPFAADVCDWDQAHALINSCVDRFGGIDGLVNNAGILGRLRPVNEETQDVARRVIDVNVLGTTFVAIHASRAMVASGTGGAIVNVTSGAQCGYALHGIYGASKGAVATLTYAWAVDLAHQGIRVNAISPGAHTGMLDDAIAQLRSEAGEVADQVGYEAEGGEHPELSDNAAVVCFLLSDASDELTGQVVRVDPGYVSIMTHPLVAEPRGHVAEWTVERLATAFRTVLAGNLQPPGLAVGKVKDLRPLH